ncbi:MAG: type II toxin-antitoxin system VapC family toxin [Nitrospirota bacterium]
MAGDPDAAKKRLGILKRFAHLDLNPTVEKMAQVYVEKLKIPRKALRDAVHLTVASVHSVDYLVTWNCSHIANGEVIRKLMQINMSHGIKTPIICTPEELMPKMKGE